MEPRPYGDYVDPASLKQVGTCKLAVAAGLFSLLCPTGLGGFVGLILGILGLGQIRATKGDLGGAPMAWLGIVLGLAQVGAVGYLLKSAHDSMEQAPVVFERFFSTASAGDLEAARPWMTTGLAPALDHGHGQEIARELGEKLGDFESVEETKFTYLNWKKRVVVEADFDLRFSKGAPATAHATLIGEYGGLKVAAFEVRSPVLDKPIGAEGRPSQELEEFGAGGKATGPRKLKAFR